MGDIGENPGDGNSQDTANLTDSNGQPLRTTLRSGEWNETPPRAEKRYRDLYENAPVGYHSAGPDRMIQDINQTELDLLGYSFEEIVGKKRFKDLIVPEQQPLFEKQWNLLLRQNELRGAEFLALRKDGGKIPVRLDATVIRDENGELAGTRCIVTDVSTQKRAEEVQAIRLRYARGLAACSRALLKKTESENPITDGIGHLLEAAEVSRIYIFENIEDSNLGLCALPTHEVCAEGIHSIIGAQNSQPSPYSLGFDRWKTSLSSGEMVFGVVDSFPKSERAVLRSQSIRSLLVLPIHVYGHWFGFIGFDDCQTDRQWAEEDVQLLQTAADIIGAYMENHNREKQLQETLEKLNKSNQELQQFAYVASHDLQEPLRMVASYTQLLSRRYKGKLDKDADEFIHYAVDGANRMQKLINDLLTYSRVGTHGKPKKPTDCEQAVHQAVANLKMAIEESRASVTWNPLPTVLGDGTQLVQLFQNLIGNSIKFRGSEPPRIFISTEENEEECIFSVQDNGIGIDPMYNDRIFLVFQRLHTIEEYPGTGIGLAVCKKIVERHGGKIWVTSKPGEGSSFSFTLPKERERHNGSPTH